MKKQNYYQRLGVEHDATPDQIKKAYRKKAALHHPDKAKPEDQAAATEKFQLLNEAHSALKDIKSKLAYDRHLSTGSTGDFDANDEFNIPWEQGEGWTPKFKNFMLVVMLVLTMVGMVGKELWIRYRATCGNYLIDVTDMTFLLRSSAIRQLSSLDTVLLTAALWYFECGEDYYVWWLVILSSIWCLLGSIVFMSPNEAPQDEAAPNILHQRYRLDSALFFAFMIVWFGWQGGGLIGSLIWASAVSCVILQAFEYSGLSKLESDNKSEIGVMGMIVFLLWIFEKSFWLRCIAAAFFLFKILQWVKKRGELEAAGPKAKEDGEFWLIVNATVIAFFCYLGWGIIWTCVVIVGITLSTTNYNGIKEADGEDGSRVFPRPMLVLSGIGVFTYAWAYYFP